MFKVLLIALGLSSCATVSDSDETVTPPQTACPPPSDASCKPICDARTIKVVTMLDKCRVELDEMSSRD